MFDRCWFLTGATAVGKSAVGLALAERLGAEIVSMDSMALYRGMDIGTAKPSAQDRQAVPHHLVDILGPHEDFSLAQYLAAAEQACVEIAARGRSVLFVGGTPLYLKALLRGIFEGPPADWEFRRELAHEAARHEPGWLHGQLLAVDPSAAARLHANDSRRLIRALEVYAKTGQPISLLQRQFEIGRPADACRVFVLDRPREELHARIDARVDAMFAAGLVDEVRRLKIAPQPPAKMVGWVKSAQTHRNHANHGGSSSDSTPPYGVSDSLLAAPQPPAKTARQAVGYAEVIDHVEGRADLPATIAAVKLHTRQLAKRQMTWFRSLSECRFVPVSGEVDAGLVAEKLMESGRNNGQWTRTMDNGQ